MWREDEGVFQRHRGKLILALLVILAFIGYRASHGCFSLWLKGLDVPYCPEGDVRQVATVRADGIERDKAAKVLVGARAYFAKGSSIDSRPVSRIEPSLFLVDQAGAETPLAAPKDFASGSETSSASIKFPPVPDGEYLLRARVKSAFGESQIDAPLALYAPARVHVITDRPLYQPGETLKFRALVVRTADLVPLENRPGSWVITDPHGQVVLEERSPSGPWGVTSNTFPLDRGAPTGAWKVRWESGGASDEVAVQVQPFSLPRFHVDVAADKSFFRPGDHPVVRGTATYASGAPVANGHVRVSWTHDGAWPLPTDWDEGGLPQAATTDKNGTFHLALPEVPSDLRGTVTLNASIMVSDETGDSAGSDARVLFSEDGIAVDAVTEITSGLVRGFNNRLYLRVSDPAGTVLPGATIRVRRAWDPTDPGIEATADEDGVAALQIDPGLATNVVIPAMPVRASPLTNAVMRTGLTDLLTQSDAPLSVARAMESLQPRLQSCARFVRTARAGIVVDVRVRRDGRVEAIAEGDDLAGRCLGRALSQTRLPAASDGLYAATFSIASAQIPELKTDISGGFQALEDTSIFDRWTLDARSCLPRDVESGPYPEQLIWQVEADSQDLDVSWRTRPGGIKLPASVTSCVRGKFTEVDLDVPALRSAVGIVRFDVGAVPRQASVAAPQATVMVGYELAVSAQVNGRDVGTTKIRLKPGEVPPVRLRATPVLAKPGDNVEVQFLRGPSFSGRVPDKLAMNGRNFQSEAGVDPKTGSARFHLPTDASGWYVVHAGAADAHVFVPPKASLAVKVTTDKPAYAPGDKARLTVNTTVNTLPAAAAVGLFGVDQSLGQMMALPGVDDLARLHAPVQMLDDTLPALDGAALASGKVRGAHAAEAVVARIESVPELAGTGQPVSTSSSGTVAFESEQADAFYAVLNELHAEVASWESHSGDEKLAATDVVRLWGDSAAACEQRGERVTDAFHRPLRLSSLPANLLALTDPAALVVNGVHRTEDVENWPAFVAKEKP